MHAQTVLFRSPDPSVPPEEAYFVTTPTPETYLTLSDDVTIHPREQRFVVPRFTSTPDSSLVIAQQHVRSRGPVSYLRCKVRARTFTSSCTAVGDESNGPTNRTSKKIATRHCPYLSLGQGSFRRHNANIPEKTYIQLV